MAFFNDENLICLNFEILDQSLRDYLQSSQFFGLTVAEFRPVIHQLATVLNHVSAMELVHADIKPDNIMIVNPEQQPLKVEVIDFGVARSVSSIDSSVCGDALVRGTRGHS